MGFPISDLGFNGLGNIGKNLGYVIAMLPDILVGTMTGRTQSLHLRDNLIPMASMVSGLLSGTRFSRWFLSAWEA